MFMADRRQVLAAAWKGERPRIASALPSQATPRLGAPSSRQHPPAPVRALISLFPALLRHSPRRSRCNPGAESPPSPLEAPARA